MRFNNIKFDNDIDAGSAAPTFNFKFSDFFNNEVTNDWKVFRKHFERPTATTLELEELLARKLGKILQVHVFNAIYRQHVQFFPEESIDSLKKLCSARFEMPRTAGPQDDRLPHQRGEAHSIDNALAARGLTLVPKEDCVHNVLDTKSVLEASATPLEALNNIGNMMARNIILRFRDAEEPIATMLVQAYLGSAMPLTVSAELVGVYKETGIAPTNEELKLQARRNPDMWQSETMQQALKKIMSGMIAPELKTLSMAGEYHRNRIWFGEESAEDVVKETISKMDVFEKIEL